MDSKKYLVSLALIFTLVNAGVSLAANETFRNFYGGFGMEDPDPDLDGISGNEDECPGSPFKLSVIQKNTKKQKVFVSFADPKDPQKTLYLRLKKMNSKEKDGNTNLVFQTAADEKFSKASLKEFTAEPNKIITINTIAQQLRVVYSNSQKGLAVIWTAGLPGSKKGCNEEESRSSALELTPP